MDDSPERRLGTVLFWIFLFLPAGLVAVVLALPKGPANLTQTVGIASLLAWPVCSLYCGGWLGVRLGRTPLREFFLGAVFTVAIAGLNFFILLAGCSRVMRFAG